MIRQKQIKQSERLGIHRATSVIITDRGSRWIHAAERIQWFWMILQRIASVDEDQIAWSTNIQLRK